MSTMESFKSEPQFSPFSPRKPSLFLFFARSCSITLYRTQPIKIELLSYYLTIMVRYRNLVRQIGPSESSAYLFALSATVTSTYIPLMTLGLYDTFPGPRETFPGHTRWFPGQFDRNIDILRQINSYIFWVCRVLLCI